MADLRRMIDEGLEIHAADQATPMKHPFNEGADGALGVAAGGPGSGCKGPNCGRHGGGKGTDKTHVPKSATTQPREKWFGQHMGRLASMGFNPDTDNTDRNLDDPAVVSFKSTTANPREVRAYFVSQGFSNTDGRTYMAHTGNPHVNLGKTENHQLLTVQISWWPKRGGPPVGVSFLRPMKGY